MSANGCSQDSKWILVGADAWIHLDPLAPIGHPAGPLCQLADTAAAASCTHLPSRQQAAPHLPPYLAASRNQTRAWARQLPQTRAIAPSGGWQLVQCTASGGEQELMPPRPRNANCPQLSGPAGGGWYAAWGPPGITKPHRPPRGWGLGRSAGLSENERIYANLPLWPNFLPDV